MLVTLTIYGRGCDTHGASPGGGRFGPHSCPGSAQKHPSQSRQRAASLPAARHRQLPSISSSSWPCSLLSGHPVPLLNVRGRVTAGFPSPQPQQGFAQLLAEAGAAGRQGEGRASRLCFYGAVHHRNPSPRTVMQFLAKHCSLVLLCYSPVIFKEKLSLISNYYHSKDPLHEVGLNFLHY